MSRIKTTIEREGQRYFDEPVYSETNARPLASEIARILGREVPKSVRNLDHYRRIPLRWVSPRAKK